jgi:hypothetical protein
MFRRSLMPMSTNLGERDSAYECNVFPGLNLSRSFCKLHTYQIFGLLVKTG